MPDRYRTLGTLKHVLDIGPEQRPEQHGYAVKDMIVLHETVSPDYTGWADVRQTSSYLAAKGYGIHGVTDAEGHAAWAYAQGRAIFYHTQSNGSKGYGRVNTRAIGIENVSRVMLDEPDNLARWRAWWKRNEQIETLAQLIAWISKTHRIPLVVSDGSKPGITTHWQVTQRFGVVGGHVDCWPRHLGGYFPLLRIIERAKYYRAVLDA